MTTDVVTRGREKVVFDAVEQWKCSSKVRGREKLVWDEGIEK